MSIAPSLKDSTIVWLAYAGVTLLAGMAVAVIVAAPWLRAHGHDLAAWVTYDAFHQICHQIPARSFFLWGQPLAVCSRCSAIVSGGLAGLLLVPILRSLRAPLPKRRWLAISVLACAVDVVRDWAGLPNSFVSRTITGSVVGALMAFYLVPAIVQAALQLCKRDAAS